MQRPLKENGKDKTSLHGDSLEGSFINKNNTSEAKGAAIQIDVNAQNGKQLVIDGFNRKCN